MNLTTKCGSILDFACSSRDCLITKKVDNFLECFVLVIKYLNVYFKKLNLLLTAIFDKRGD